LSKLSSSHLYNLRKSFGYQALRVSFTTHPVCNVIGVRKAPRPNRWLVCSIDSITGHVMKTP
jgi:hypothetical protein